MHLFYLHFFDGLRRLASVGTIAASQSWDFAGAAIALFCVEQMHLSHGCVVLFGRFLHSVQASESLSRETIKQHHRVGGALFCLHFLFFFAFSLVRAVALRRPSRRQGRAGENAKKAKKAKKQRKPMTSQENHAKKLQTLRKSKVLASWCSRNL